MDENLSGNVKLYILLKYKGEYSQSKKERWIFTRLQKPDDYQEYEAIYTCKKENLIEPRGRTHTDDGWQLQPHTRELFLTPYGNERLNQLISEYMKDYRKTILSYAKIVLELIAAIVGILAFLS